ncbi:MAG: peptide ABC transporter ATP-binding protein, partial [Planctomycetes bacterium]|nr:peptide ABC transporter ATP-binding protein [Planctomycetota bacterium]
LLRCVPSVGARRELRPIPGEVPNPLALPPGCKFNPRCPFVQDRCRATEPLLFSVPDPPSERLVRCVLYDKGAPS